MKRMIGLSVFSALSMAALNVCHAAEQSSQFECVLSDQKAKDSSVSARADFNKDTPEIYLTCSTSQVEKGQVVKAIWIADDTHGVAPANYKIDEKSYDVVENLKSGEMFTTYMSLSKPNTGWPLGSYHVDFYLGDKLLDTYKFAVN